MDRSDPLQLHSIMVELTRNLSTLGKHCRAAAPEARPSDFYTLAFVTCITECVAQTRQFGITITTALTRPQAVYGWPTADNICTMAMDLGLHAVIVALLQALLPNLQTSIYNPAVSSNGSSRPASTATPEGAATATATTPSILPSTMLGWEWRSDIQPCLTITLSALSSLQWGTQYLSPTSPSHKLSLHLLSDGLLLRVLRAASNRSLTHLLHTKIMGRVPMHAIMPDMFLEICNAGIRVLLMVINMPLDYQLTAIRSLPRGYLDTVCRLHVNLFDPTRSTSQTLIRTVAMLATSVETDSLIKVMRNAQQRDPASAKRLAEELSSPCMQRITHLTLAYLIPRTAVGRVTQCASTLSELGNSPSALQLKQNHLLSIKLLLEGMLTRLDAEYEHLQKLDRSSTVLYLRLGWSDASTTPSNPCTPSACDALGHVWGCGSTPEEKMLLSPEPTKLSSLIFEIVRLGMWDMPNWGALCCRVIGALLRSCFSLACNTQMRSELGGAMLAVARLATATARHVLRQHSPNPISLAFTQLPACSSLEKQKKQCNSVACMGSDLAASLRVLVTQMLRVGKFCSEKDWRVTGFTGPMVIGDWHVKLKKGSQINWLLMPGALVTLEMHMRVSAAHLMNPKNHTAGINRFCGTAMSPDLIPLLMAHRRLLSRTWIAFISAFDPQEPGTGGPSVFDRYLAGVAGKTLSLTRTLCKLMMLAAGLVSDPDFASPAIRGFETGAGSKHDSAHVAELEATQFEVAIQAEEMACTELQQLFLATTQLFTGYGTEEERSPSRRTTNRYHPNVKVAPARESKEGYLAGDLVHATSLRLTLMLGRCCALIAAGNRKRGWHVSQESVARYNNHTGPHGAVRSHELAGMRGRQAQARALREGGVFSAAEWVERGADHTFVLTLRTGYFALLHPQALVACGFNVASREAASVPDLSNCGFETLLTLRLQSLGFVVPTPGPSKTQQATATAHDHTLEAIAWERYSYTQLTGLAFPGCHNWGCSSFIGFNDAVLPTLLCGGCKRARYCSVRCQQAAWKSGGHSGVCSELTVLSKATVQHQPSSFEEKQQAEALENQYKRSTIERSMEDFSRAMSSMFPVAKTSYRNNVSSNGSSSSHSGPSVIRKPTSSAEGNSSLAYDVIAPNITTSSGTVQTATSSAANASSTSSSRSSSTGGLQSTSCDDPSLSNSSKPLKGGFFDRPASASTANKQRPTTAASTKPTSSKFGFTFGSSNSSSSNRDSSRNNSATATADLVTAATASPVITQQSTSPAVAIMLAPTPHAITSGGLSERPVVIVTSDNLLRLAKLVNSVTVPTTFDLGGRVFQNYYTGSCSALDGAGHFDVTVDGTCLRNGTFKMGPDEMNKASVRLYGKGVLLEDVRVYGGYGIQVVTDAEVTLHRCWVRNALEGICTMTNFGHEYIPRKKGSPEGVTRLTARDTKVTDCRICGIRVERCSEVDLFDCEFSRNISGMTVCGNDLSRVRAKGVRCVGNTGRGVRIGLGCDVVLTECELTGNAGGPMDVNGEGTRLVLAGCLFDGQVVSSNGGKVEVRGREFGKLASAHVCAATWP